MPTKPVEPQIGLIELGQTAYHAYGDSVGWKNYQGNPMPLWENLTAAIQTAWIAAAVTIAKIPTEKLAHLFPDGKE